MMTLYLHKRTSQQGFGLIEVLIAMTLGLLLLGGVGYLFMGSKQMSVAQTDAIRMNESVRNAMDVMGRALRQANYKLRVEEDLADAPLDGVDGGGTGVAALSDILVVRHDPNRLTPAPGVPDPLQGSESNCEGAVITSNNPVDPSNGATGVNENLVIYQFRVVSGRLMCFANDSTGSVPSAGVVIAENIENLQVSYGIGTGQETIVNYIDQPTPAQFLQVGAVRVTLLVRGPSSKGVVGGAQTLNFNGATLTVTDGHLRSVVTTTFTVRNQTKWKLKT